MSFPKYEAYKDSGVEWLGDVPEYWELMPFFSRFRERNEKNTGLKEDNLLSLSYGHIIQKDINALDGLLPESFETYQIVNPCDIVFRLTDLQNDKRSLRSAIVRQRGIITSAYLAVEAINIDPSFANHLFRAYDLLKVFYSMGGGLRQSMKYSDVKWLPLLTPLLSEQTQIARFLDHETARIDALIAEQQRLIELLKEKRQAVISHAVTKGLDSTVPMKNSGVEWLGEVPAHWSYPALKYVCALLKDGTHLPPPRVDDGIPLLSVRNIVLGNFVKRDDDSNISYESYKELCRSFIPQENDVLLAIVGATLGKTAIVKAAMDEFHIQRSLAIFRARSSKMQSEWLHLIFRSRNFQNLLWENVGFSAQPGIYLGTLAAFCIPLPPLDEQENIVSQVKEAVRPIDKLLKEAELSCQLIQERRSALISAAVTGKIDIRGWQAPASATPAPTLEPAHS